MESPEVWIYILEVIPSATRHSNIKNEYSTQADLRYRNAQNCSEAAKQLVQMTPATADKEDGENAGNYDNKSCSVVIRR